MNINKIKYFIPSDDWIAMQTSSIYETLEDAVDAAKKWTARDNQRRHIYQLISTVKPEDKTQVEVH
jgi:hypothetical protein